MSKINKISVFHLSLTGLVYFISIFGLKAQTAVFQTNHTGGFEWKSEVEMQQIIQQELNQTNAELTLPNLTDWSAAMLEAYRSLLTFTVAEMQVKPDMDVVLDKAFNLMKMESVPNPAARAMVLDDMQAKKTELIIKLTNQ